MCHPVEVCVHKMIQGGLNWNLSPIPPGLMAVPEISLSFEEINEGVDKEEMREERERTLPEDSSRFQVSLAYNS